jgi:hypothetical protein
MTFGCNRGLSGDEITEDIPPVLEFGPKLAEMGQGKCVGKGAIHAE